MSSPAKQFDRRRGTILIVTMWIIMVLASLVLVLAQAMQVELVASANDCSRLQAEAIEAGAIQYVLANVDSLQGQMPDPTVMACQTVHVGDGAFWIICPNYDDDTTMGYGLTDEAGKVNLNTASLAVLEMLPDITEDMANSIIDWRSATGGAMNDYYMTQPDPYQCKKAPFETVEELLLVYQASTDILFGSDTNRSGVQDASEVGTIGPFDRGLFPFVTVYSAEPNTTTDGKARVNVNTAGANLPLATLLAQRLGASRAMAIMQIVRRTPSFKNLFDFSYKAGLTNAEFAKLADRLKSTTATSLRGMINVATAPSLVLQCLPTLESSDADALIALRENASTDLTNVAWVTQALTRAKAVAIGGLITSRTYQFSADIVSVSKDGRAFRRCRIVVDARKSPPTVVYRKDMTGYGWPLDPGIISGLRAGKSLDVVAPVTTTVSGGVGH